MVTGTEAPNIVKLLPLQVPLFASNMHSENSTVLMTNDLQPTKSGLKTGYQGVNGHISQIPGLSPTVSCTNEEKARGRRSGVRDSDSDYVKLAKQGGHKGLLSHDEIFTSKPTAYKPPDWFCAASEIDSASSKDKKNSAGFQQLEPPFGSDKLSAWERTDNSSAEEKNNNFPNNPMDKLHSSNLCKETSKFKRIVFDKKPAPVDMSKLLSFGYAEEERPAANTLVSKDMKTASLWPNHAPLQED